VLKSLALVSVNKNWKFLGLLSKGSMQMVDQLQMVHKHGVQSYLDSYCAQDIVAVHCLAEHGSQFFLKDFFSVCELAVENS
jgi:hypothetical protein